ncbi:MAG: metallophosphoesterase [Pirellulaceae bacterium]
MSSDSGRLIAVGDVRGCGHAFQTILKSIAPTADDQLVFLGDLIDQGRDSAEVLDQLIELQNVCDVVVIKGNHEEMLFAAQEGDVALRYWENCGGVSTLNSYRFGATLSDIPPEHWALLSSCQPYYETDRFILTHANYRPDLPMAEQKAYQLRWALLEPDEMEPHQSGKTVVVGHTEQKNSEVLDLGFVICIDTACWRHGWLTAIELNTGELWQASRWGMLREPEEPTHRGLVPVGSKNGAS